MTGAGERDELGQAQVDQSLSRGAPADERGRLTVALSPPQMKIAHSAVRLLVNDLQREQAEEREALQRILGKLPDEHVMRAIEL